MNNPDFKYFLSSLTKNGIKFYDSSIRQSADTSETEIRDLFYMPHAHEHLEMICVIEGNPLIGINHRWKKAASGEVKVFTPGALHAEHYSDRSEGYRLLWITLFPQSLLFHMTAYSQGNGYSESMKRLSLAPPMSSALWEVMREKGFVESVTLRARFHFLLMECLCYVLENDMLQETDAAYYHEKVVEQIINYIDNYYREDITLELLAGMVRYSPQHLNMIFKKHTQVPLHRYICNIRLEKSKELLRSGNMLVKQVAAACGFHDPLYFSNKFKKQFGISPLQFQENPTND